MSGYYVATFKNAPGRYLVEDCGNGWDGYRIRDKRQLKYGNQPDTFTGLWLDENYRSFGRSEVKTLHVFTRKAGARVESIVSAALALGGKRDA